MRRRLRWLRAQGVATAGPFASLTARATSPRKTPGSPPTGVRLQGRASGRRHGEAKAAVDALKEPGMKGPDRSAPPDEETRAREGQSGPERR
jgi:hypothetical protein